MFRKLLSTSALLLALLAPGPQGVTPPPAAAADRYSTEAGEPGRVTRQIKLAIAKSTILDFDEDLRDILVSNPSVADAVVRTNRRLYLLGNKYGTTNIFIFGSGGRQIANLEVMIQPDTATLETLLRRLLPDADIRIEGVAGAVVLSGSVRTPADATRAQEVATQFLGGSKGNSGGGGGSGATLASSIAAISGGGGGGGGGAGESLQVINALSIRGKDQVMLRVTIVEMQRTILKNLGVDLTASVGGLKLTTVNGTTDTSTWLKGTYTSGSTSLSAQLKALEQNGVLRTLAEPTLTAVSGEEATFLVGGEYPIPVAQQNNTLTIEFKKYGISLGFVPVVLSEGRISLKVNTEVSELTNDGAINLGTLKVSALQVRRADGTVELPSGGTIVMAGLIKDNIRNQVNGTPGLLNLPILGSLFRSREYQRNQTELAIFVQPLVVGPVQPGKLQRPDQNFQPGTDAAANFLGRLNRVYRVGGSPDATYHGQYGFIYE